MYMIQVVKLAFMGMETQESISVPKQYETLAITLKDMSKKAIK